MFSGLTSVVPASKNDNAHKCRSSTTKQSEFSKSQWWVKGIQMSESSSWRTGRHASINNVSDVCLTVVVWAECSSAELFSVWNFPLQFSPSSGVQRRKRHVPLLSFEHGEDPTMYSSDFASCLLFFTSFHFIFLHLLNFYIPENDMCGRCRSIQPLIWLCSCLELSIGVHYKFPLFFSPSTLAFVTQRRKRHDLTVLVWAQEDCSHPFQLSFSLSTTLAPSLLFFVLGQILAPPWICYSSSNYFYSSSLKYKIFASMTFATNDTVWLIRHRPYKTLSFE